MNPRLELAEGGTPPSRIAMAVNNPGSNDARVVRAAEAAARAGYDVHVVGLTADGFSAHERINGVSYHRVAAGSELTGFVAELVPGIFGRKLTRRWLAGQAAAHGRGGREQGSGKNSGRISLAAPGLGSFRWSRPQDFFPMLAVSLLYRVNKYVFKPGLRKVRGAPQAIRQTVVKQLSGPAVGSARGSGGLMGRLLQPLSSLWPRYQQGRYLSALGPKLMELKADIYHAHELPALGGCALAAELNQARLVYDSHELEPHRNALWTRAERQFWANRERELIRHADEVITVSYSLAGELMKLYGLDRVTVIRNTPPWDFVVPETGLRSSLGLGPEIPLMVFVGLLTRNRGLDLALQALARLPEYHLATVGPVNQVTLAQVREQSRRLGVEDRFHVHPKVPYKQLVSFISSADLSLIPLKNACLSYFCALPNKLFESVFAGLPVAASNFPDLALFIQENQVGALFDPDDIGDMARKIKWVYENRRKLMPPEKVASIRRMHCFEQEAEKLFRLYGRLGFPPPSLGARGTGQPALAAAAGLA